MSRLVVNPGSPDAWEIELKPGPNLLGREEGSDVVIDHDTVDGSHCEITADDGGAGLRDLGSAAGTYVAGRRITEERLADGATFQAGAVEFRFVAGPPPGSPVLAAPLPAEIPLAPRMPGTPMPGAGPVFCQSHHRTQARFHCPACGTSFCDLCVNTRHVGGVAAKFCRACGGPCSPLVVRRAPAVKAKRSFARAIGDSFVFPFRRDGLVLLTTGTIFVSVMNGASYIAQFAFIIGGLAILVLGIFGSGYFTNWYRRIVTSSAAGDEAMPDWPDVADVGGDILTPLGHLLAAILVSFLPLIVVHLFVPGHAASAPALTWAARAFAYAYFPMAFLAVCMLESVVAVNPILVFHGISRMPLPYLLTVLVFTGILLVQRAADTTLPTLLPIPIVPALIASFVQLYLFTVMARVLGVLYRENQTKLGWVNGA